MTDKSDKNETDAENEKRVESEEKKSGKWSTSAKVGAAVGSAAVAAALIYAGRHKMKKAGDHKSSKLKEGTRYENEPEDEPDDEDQE